MPDILDILKGTLNRLRGRFSGKAEAAYEARDAAPAESREEAYAAGEAHAFGEASDEIRKEQEDEEES